ncbi:hypothetical protein ACFQET_05500 [Levilactobacillus tangyuanensis]|uniref:Uncharacterized protein n=1 Tax=Levilactobacillus tangyuanensis TaxID=2486021 RepID=A0ABW1TMM0_9LACO|nr:hypothetical protein [Levilactobacillus tangyuanensis]
MSLKRLQYWRYLKSLIYGLLAVMILLTSNLVHRGSHWTIDLSAFTVWVILSWLTCYPFLRRHYMRMFKKNDPDLRSFKTRALDLHQRDLNANHKDRRWTPNGVTANPWTYMSDTTQSTDEILNPIFIFVEHLWYSLLLIVFGPILMVGQGIKWLVKSFSH